MNDLISTNPTEISVASDWEILSIEALCERVTSGATPSRSESRYYQGGTIPWFKTKELGFLRLVDSEEKITDAAIRETSAKLFPPGTVLMAMYGDGKTITSLGILEVEAATNQACCAMIPNAMVCDSRFLYYSLSHYKQDFLQIANGGAQRNLSGALIKNFCVGAPPLFEQKSIAHILGTLDDKIELNRKTNETLEAMAKALFKSWFVDFDPVRAKAEGRPTGLPAEISDLFPDSFEDSELGEIPRGWSISTIGNAVGEVFDGPHATPKEASDGYVFLGIKNMTGSSLDLAEKRWIGLDDWEQWTKRVVPTCGDIVFTYEAALGLFAVIPSGLTCCLGRRMALIRPRGNEPNPYFWFHQFVAEPFQRLIDERSIHGATVNRTPLTEFPQYPVLTPPIEIRNLFDSNAAVLWSRIHLGSNEIEKLASARDALLPKLISGEIRIPDAEKMLEEVGV